MGLKKTGRVMAQRVHQSSDLKHVHPSCDGATKERDHEPRDRGCFQKPEKATRNRVLPKIDPAEEA